MSYGIFERKAACFTNQVSELILILVNSHLLTDGGDIDINIFSKQVA